MLAPTKTHPTESTLVPLHLMVRPSSINRIKKYVESLEKPDAILWRDMAEGRGSVPAAVLRGARSKAELTQIRLSELSGIPQRHISEMERGKRTIGKENARKLAIALKTDYRVFL